MKPQTLAQQALTLVETGSQRSPRYQNIGQLQRERLTAAAMRDAGKHAYEYITNSGFIEDIAGTLINCLETTDAAKRQELRNLLADLLIDAVVDEAKPTINEALDTAVTELAVTRQFYQGPNYNNQNYNTFKRAIYNHPEL